MSSSFWEIDTNQKSVQSRSLFHKWSIVPRPVPFYRITNVMVLNDVLEGSDIQREDSSGFKHIAAVTQTTEAKNVPRSQGYEVAIRPSYRLDQTKHIKSAN
jgi:hypothetical protein